MKICHKTSKKNITTTRSGRKNPTFSLEAEFCDGMDFLIKAITQDDVTAHEFPSVATLGWGHTVTYGAPVSGSATLGTKDDLMTGAVLTEFNISGSAGDDIVTMTSNWVCKELTHGQDLSSYTMSGITDATPPTHIPFFFYNVAVSALGGNITNMNSFNLKLMNGLNPEDNQFQNNQTRNNPTVVKYGGTLELEYIADDTFNDDAYDNLYGDTALPVTLTFANGTTTYTMTLYGQIQKWERANPDEGEYIGKITYELAEDSSNIPLSIAIS